MSGTSAPAVSRHIGANVPATIKRDVTDLGDFGVLVTVWDILDAKFDSNAVRRALQARGYEFTSAVMALPPRNKYGARTCTKFLVTAQRVD